MRLVTAWRRLNAAMDPPPSISSNMRPTLGQSRVRVFDLGRYGRYDRYDLHVLLSPHTLRGLPQWAAAEIEPQSSSRNEMGEAVLPTVPAHPAVPAVPAIQALIYSHPSGIRTPPWGWCRTR